MGWPILYLKGLPVKLSKAWCFSDPKDWFILENSADPDIWRYFILVVIVCQSTCTCLPMSKMNKGTCKQRTSQLDDDRVA